MNIRFLQFRLSALVVSVLVISTVAMAAPPLPGSADAGRVNPEPSFIPPDRSHDQQVTIPSVLPNVPIPEGAKTIHLTLKTVIIRGATVFTPEQLVDIYAPYVGKDVTLDTIWKIAGTITERYRNAGYFLSRAYVPQQSIKDGTIIIKVVEGYIGQVDIPEEWRSSRIAGKYIDRLLEQRPAKADLVESTLLRLDDLPGYSFRSVLSPIDKDKDEAAVKLTLVPVEKDGKGSIGFDNFSSRYLGPNELSAFYTKSFLPLQQTSFLGQLGLPIDRLEYGLIDHKIILVPDVELELNGGVTAAHPGYTLSPEDINSIATTESIALNYQWIRQRQENLSFKLAFDHRDVSSNLLGSELTRDYIHAIRIGANYDLTDEWGGYNTVATTVSRGLNILGNSQKNDADLSRAGALPDFTKAELYLSRQQVITDDWSVLAAASGQWASGVLYSSEQFGYGGQAFGRAYDSSEITGDQGLTGSMELRYDGWEALQPVSLQPYAFYDIGGVWNAPTVGQDAFATGSSAGLGVRMNTAWHQTGNLGVAFPLGRRVSVPIYGSSAYGPRLMLEISQNF